MRSGNPEIQEQEIVELSTQKYLTSPQTSDREQDTTPGPSVLLRRHSAPSVITIFEGGHEAILKWFWSG